MFVTVLIHTYKRGEVSNPLGVSLEAQCPSPNPLSPRLGILSPRLIPREAHGHNRSAHDETSHLPTNTLSVYLSYGFPFLTEKLFTAFSRILGRNISKVSFWLLTLAKYFYPLGL
jgi:hypothetical protein